MTASEQAGKVATSAIDALKSTPAFLMLLLFQIILVGGTIYLVNARNEMFIKQFDTLMQHCVTK